MADKPKKPRSRKAPGAPTLRVVPSIPAPEKTPGVQHETTEHSRTLVQMGLAIGYTHAQIADMVGVSVNTLKKYYKAELARGGDAINLAIAANLAAIAQSPSHPKAVTAGIYWTKTRMGWKEPVFEPDEDDEPTEFTLDVGGVSNARN